MLILLNWRSDDQLFVYEYFKEQQEENEVKK